MVISKISLMFFFCLLKNAACHVVRIKHCLATFVKKMKFNSLIIGISIATSAISFSSSTHTSSLAESSSAEDIFSCDTNRMSTMVKTKRGMVPLIHWKNRSFDPVITPKQRCQTASEKLQQLHNKGEIKYIRTDTVNNSPVICGVSKIGNYCLPDGILAMLQSEEENADNTLLQILDRRIWIIDPCWHLLYCSDRRKIVFQENEEIYFNLELFLKENNNLTTND